MLGEERGALGGRGERGDTRASLGVQILRLQVQIAAGFCSCPDSVPTGPPGYSRTQPGMGCAAGSGAPGLVPRHPPAVPGVEKKQKKTNHGGIHALGWGSKRPPGHSWGANPIWIQHLGLGNVHPPGHAGVQIQHPGLGTEHPPGHSWVQILSGSSTLDWAMCTHPVIPGYKSSTLNWEFQPHWGCQPCPGGDTPTPTWPFLGCKAAPRGCKT